VYWALAALAVAGAGMVCLRSAQAAGQPVPSAATNGSMDVPATPEEQRLNWVFVAIPPGEFDMGCSPNDDECANEEKPRHHVRLSRGFQIGKYPVTQAMWESVMPRNFSHFKGADLPVEGVTWDDVQVFLGKVNARHDGYRYRLPTEAEWEYAARAGTTGPRYGPLDDVAWYADNSGPSRISNDELWRMNKGDWKKSLQMLIAHGDRTHPVGQKQPNPWGLYDMLGNVWQWTSDWWDEKYYEHSPGVDPPGPASGQSKKVRRGGSWIYGSQDARASARNWWLANDMGYCLGFRCVRQRKP
jgi:formylglycine-generating enzyme required for sulfatase activity